MTFTCAVLAGVHQWTKQGNDAALSNLYRAIELDPNFAAVFGLAARCYVQRRSGGWLTDFAEAVAEAERLARRAAALGKDDAVALATAGFAVAHLVEDMEGGDALINRALLLNPNLAWAWLFSGWAKVALGQSEEAIEQLNRAMRLSPNDPQSFSAYAALGLAHLIAGRYGQALTFAEVAWRAQPEFLPPKVYSRSKRRARRTNGTAQKAMLVLRQLDPTLCLSNLRNLQPIQRAEAYAKWEEGMRLAGLPE